MTFDTTEYDFGDIQHRLPRIECSFGFTNDGDAPLVVVKVSTSCSCTKADYPKKPVMPGQRGAITVTYEPNKKEAGVFHKAIEVYSNADGGKRKTLIIKGNAVQ